MRLISTMWQAYMAEILTSFVLAFKRSFSTNWINEAIWECIKLGIYNAIWAKLASRLSKAGEFKYKSSIQSATGSTRATSAFSMAARAVAACVACSTLPSETYAIRRSTKSLFQLLAKAWKSKELPTYSWNFMSPTEALLISAKSWRPSSAIFIC